MRAEQHEQPVTSTQPYEQVDLEADLLLPSLGKLQADIAAMAKRKNRRRQRWKTAHYGLLYASTAFSAGAGTTVLLETVGEGWSAALAFGAMGLGLLSAPLGTKKEQADAKRTRDEWRILERRINAALDRAQRGQLKGQELGEMIDSLERDMFSLMREENE